jgi:hypothetical protein
MIRTGKPEPGQQWTVALVRAELVEAVAWVSGAGGKVGGRDTVTAHLPFRATLEEHLAEGWGLPECADPDAELAAQDRRALRLQPTARRVAQLEAALTWTATHVAPSNAGSARMLSLWLACKVHRRSFDRAVRELGVQPGHAYRLRDRALTLIAVGLDSKGLRPGP